MVEPSRIACHSLRTTEPEGSVSRCAHPLLRASHREVSTGVCQSCRLKHQLPPDRFFASPGQSERIVERGSVQIVVAKYQEDVRWVSVFAGLSVTVYDKGDPLSPNSLPNVGREAHTYLHHIINNYDALPDVTVFLQGNPFDHCGPLLPERVWQLHREDGFVDLCHLALPEDAFGNPTQPGLPLAEVYREVFGEDPPEFFICRVGACFAVSRERVRSRSIEFYQRLLRLSVDHKLGPWLLERYWWKIFDGVDITSGVVTAASADYFDELRLMLQSLQIHSDYPVCVFDLGLTKTQRRWIEGLPGVSVHQPAWECTYLARIRNLPCWPLWSKPFLVYASPFRRTLWIDADCTVVSGMEDIFRELDERPVLVRDQTPARTENTEAFYRCLPVGSASTVVSPNAPNSGVVGLDLHRDRELLAAWAWAAGMVARNPTWAREVAWCDQGVLLWALKRLDSTFLVRESNSWNCASFEVKGMIDEAVRNGASILNVIAARFPATVIVHWLGCFKLSSQLRREMDDLIFRGFSRTLSSTGVDSLLPS